jgi:putative nucleotidyltransferase with HDIG domain
MPEFSIGTIEGGITRMVIRGEAGNADMDLFQALSHLSQKHGHVLIDLSGLVTGSDKFFVHLQEISARTRIKIIATAIPTVEQCRQIGLSVFPTEKSAALSYAGDETIRLLLSRLRDVPILNTEAYQLISYVSSAEATFPQLETMIKSSSGLCSQVFRMANSSFFKRTSRAETLQQALVTLGFSTLRQLFIYNFYTSVGGFFRAQSATIDHGRKCALLAEYIAKSGGANSDECAKVRLAALLHDIGKQALAFFFPQQYERVHTLVKTDGKSSYLAELVVFGTEHQTVGSLLATRWNFPEYLAQVIGDHHYLQAKNWNILTLPVFCANSYLNEADREPFSLYFQKLEGYFFLKKKELPWKNITKGFSEFLTSQDDLFS